MHSLNRNISLTSPLSIMFSTYWYMIHKENQWQQSFKINTINWNKKHFNQKNILSVTLNELTMIFCMNLYQFSLWGSKIRNENYILVVDICLHWKCLFENKNEFILYIYPKNTFQSFTLFKRFNQCFIYSFILVIRIMWGLIQTNTFLR